MIEFNLPSTAAPGNSFDVLGIDDDVEVVGHGIIPVGETARFVAKPLIMEDTQECIGIEWERVDRD